MLADSENVFKTVFTAFNKMMSVLMSAPYTFHLTGSRFFGYQNDTSDWDFFTGVPGEGFGKLRQWLTQHGFQECKGGGYDSPPDTRPSEFLGVWIHREAKVHIQIVEDVLSKLEIQFAMKAVPGMTEMLRSLSKEDRKVVWRIGQAIFEAGKANERRNSRRTGNGWG